MTLTVHTELEQGSQAWLDARCGILTASVIGKLITPSTLKPANNDTSRGVLNTLAAERITGHVEYVHPSFDMQRGTEDEPFARAVYAEHYAPVTEIGFAVMEFSGRKLGASPDGLVGRDGGIEIKSRKPSVQMKTILDDEVPRENIAQIQTCMLVLGRAWWDYISYAEGMPLYVKRVYPDAQWQNAIVDVLEKFEDDIAEVITRYEKATEGLHVSERRPRIEEIVF